MKKTMQDIARAVGDRATRERMTADIQLRESPPARGNLIVTAEFPPDINESGAARLFFIEMPKNGIDLEMLSFFHH